MRVNRIPTIGGRFRVLDIRTAKPGPKLRDPIYATPEHRAWAALVVERARGQCQDPLHDPARPRSSNRLYADHVRELQDLAPGEDPFDPANGLARCASCHARKTALVRAQRQRA